MIWLIKQMLNDISGNVDEAKNKIATAYKIREVDKPAADWYREMAAAHVNFNTNGQTAISKLIERCKMANNEDPNVLGQLQVYDELRAEVLAQTMQVQGMISAYK